MEEPTGRKNVLASSGFSGPEQRVRPSTPSPTHRIAARSSYGDADSSWQSNESALAHNRSRLDAGHANQNKKHLKREREKILTRLDKRKQITPLTPVYQMERRERDKKDTHIGNCIRTMKCEAILAQANQAPGKKGGAYAQSLSSRPTVHGRSPRCRLADRRSHTGSSN